MHAKLSKIAAFVIGWELSYTDQRKDNLMYVLTFKDFREIRNNPDHDGIIGISNGYRVDI